MTNLRPNKSLVLTALLLTAGCIGLGDPDVASTSQVPDETPPEVAGNATASNLTRTVVNMTLGWTQAAVTPPGGVTDVGRIEGINCLMFETDGPTKVVNGMVTVNWSWGEVSTSHHTILLVMTPDFEHYVEHRLGPVHDNTDYNVDISGWDLTTDAPTGLIVGFVAPGQIYVAADNTASVEIVLEHTGSVGDPMEAHCY